MDTVIETEQDLFNQLLTLPKDEISALMFLACGAARGYKRVGLPAEFFDCIRFAIREWESLHKKDCRTCAKIACHDEAQYGTDCPAWIEKTYKKGAF